MIEKMFSYPYQGYKPVYYDNFIFKIVDLTTNTILLEQTATERDELSQIRSHFNIIKKGHYANEVGFKEYNDSCFEYTIFIKNEKETIEHKILVYIIGFLLDKQ